MGIVVRTLILVLAAVFWLAGTHDADAKSHKKHRHTRSVVTDIEKSEKYAAIVGEPETGLILYERRPDAQRYPASLTKMMTLYELFGALQSGRVKLTDKFSVSSHAAVQAPSKLGVKAGESIRVIDAIKAIVVISANDVAVVVAENLAGSEQAFAKRMTADAQLMGMTGTHFVNASGLPDDDQLSTARDMYTLATRLIADFPQYYDYFALETFRWNGRVFHGHNHLIGKVHGVDGIKTGYTRASGFHLVTSAVQNGHRLVAVVMGGATSHQRDNKMTSLLRTEFAALLNGKSGEAGGNGARMAAAYPRPNPLRTDSATAAADPTTPRPNPLYAETQTARNDPPYPRPNPLLAETPMATAPADEQETSVSALLVPEAQAAQQEPTPPSVEVRWGIQIGAYVSKKTASTKLAAARKALPKLLGHARQTVSRVAVDDTAYYRARFAPFDESEAKRACALLEPRGFKCFAIQQPEAEMASDTP